MITYPEHCPLPKLRKTQKHQNGLIQTTMQTGYARTRRPFVNTPTRMEFEVRCKKAAACQFEGFVKYSLNGYTAPFLLNILTPQGLVLHQVRFITDPMEDVTPINRLVWVYKAEIEIANRAVISVADMVEQLFGPGVYENFVESAEQSFENFLE